MVEGAILMELVVVEGASRFELLMVEGASLLGMVKDHS